MTIRKATETDVPQLVELKEPKTEEYRKKFEENQHRRLQEMQQEKAVYLIAEDNSKILGQLFLKLYGSETEPDFPNMQDLYVDAVERGKGIGTQLIHEAEKIAKEKGYAKISLAVNPTLNPKAEALYERLEYHKTDTQPYIDGVYDGVEDWCVDMVKEL